MQWSIIFHLTSHLNQRAGDICGLNSLEMVLAAISAEKRIVIYFFAILSKKKQRHSNLIGLVNGLWELASYKR